MINEKKYTTVGIYFDLMPIFNDINSRFFDDDIKASLRWGHRKMNGWAKRSIRLGSYDPIKKRITISPSLDQAMVPLICIERILFHEMLHQFLPAQKHQSGKTSIHHPEFNRFEKKYPYLEEADLWLRANMARLLRY